MERTKKIVSEVLVVTERLKKRRREGTTGTDKSPAKGAENGKTVCGTERGDYQSCRKQVQYPHQKKAGAKL